jgi:hypothetical protein
MTGTGSLFGDFSRTKFGILELLNPGQSIVQPAGN